MGVSFSSHISANIFKSCHNNQSLQQNLSSRFESLNQMQGLDQLFASQFGGSAHMQANSFKANFCAPGSVPQPGQLVSLSHQSFRGAANLGHQHGLGRMGFAQALQHSLAINGLGGNPFMEAGGFGFPGQFGGMQGFGGAAGCFGGAQHWNQALGGMNGCLQGQMGLGAHSHRAMNAAGYNKTSVGQGQPASFPPAGNSPYLNSLTNHKQNAKRLNVSGRHDVRTINTAIGQLKGAQPKISMATPGQKPGPGQLQLSQAQVAAIRNAPTSAEAQALVRNAIAAQTGRPSGTGNMGDKKSIRRNENRNQMNALLGTNVRSGREKNSGSSLVMNEIASDVAASIRGGSFGTTAVSQEYGHSAVGAGACGAMGYFEGGKTTAEFANGPTGLNVDLNGYKQAAGTVGELYSPLIFDLEGQGLALKNGGMIEVDLDGDGNYETISELDAHIGLLIFDSKTPEDETNAGAGRDMFGNGTNLEAYGIEGDGVNGGFDNGFDALRALCEKLDLVSGDKQHLDADDLALLEKEVGLAMRVGGIADGEDQSFSQIGITRIDLGNPEKIQDIKDAEEDMYGNRLMRQEGATFVVNSDTRDYVDIWFNILARAEMDDFNDDDENLTTSQLMAMQRRI
jgi:hypothetical protein